ncbi:MAG: QueT transporter family protein [Clostridia bacterium]
MKLKPKVLVEGAAIAALYIVLTLLSFALNLSSGLIQLRLSEALCVLPFFSPVAVFGLFIGCFFANILTGAVFLDIVFGSIATLVAAILALWFKNLKFSRWLIPLPSVVVNALIVGSLLVYAYGVTVPLYAAVLYVAAGQILACYGIGMPLFYALEKSKIFLPK